MTPMRVIVCGGRDYNDRAKVEDVLLFFNPAKVTIITGAARGADWLADRIARRLGFTVEQCRADWAKHGRAAGPIRNKQMLDAGADLVVAFPGGRGTEHMALIARKAGVPVFEP